MHQQPAEGTLDGVPRQGREGKAEPARLVGDSRVVHGFGKVERNVHSGLGGSELHEIEEELFGQLHECVAPLTVGVPHPSNVYREVPLAHEVGQHAL